MFARAQVQRRVTTSLRGDWIRFRVKAKGWTRLEITEGSACCKERPAWDLGCKGSGTKLRRKLPRLGSRLTSAADHIGGVRLSGPLSPAPAALWGSRGNARAHGDRHRARNRGPGCQRPPTPRSQPSVAPGPRPASGHIGAFHPPPPALPRSPKWCGPAPPPATNRGGSLPVT